MKHRKRKLIITILGIVFICQHIAFVLANAAEYKAAEDEWYMEGEDEETDETEETEETDETEETESTDYEQLEQEDIDGSFSFAPVTYMEEEYYAITVPKNIVLDQDGITDFQIQIKGNISPVHHIQVEAIDMLDDREGTNFYLTDAGVKLAADVIQEKTLWDYEDIRSGAIGEGRIIMEDVYPGEWNGELCFQIKEQKANGVHKHIYQKRIVVQPTCEEEGLMHYSCECGDGYTEIIDMVDHQYRDGYCIMCGEEKDEDNEEWEEDGEDEDEDEEECDGEDDEELENDETEGSGIQYEKSIDDVENIEMYNKIYY